MPAQHTYALHYHNGHFYDPDTRQRLLLRDGAELQLTAPPEAFVPFEPAGDYTPRLRSEEQMGRSLDADDNVSAYYPLLPAGAELYFVLHPPKPPVPGATVASYTFRVVLDEPLFVGLPVPRGSSLGSLVDCACHVAHATRSSSGLDAAPDRLAYFEPVYAHSLNSLIKNTYVHYFQNAGSPGRSAPDTMKVAHTGQTLGELRKQVVPTPPAPG